MKSIFKFLMIVIFSIFGILLVFNVMTPFICKYMPNQFAKADLVLDSLKSSDFQPEVLAFGSSLVQTGVDGYVLRKELNTSKVYNLAVPSYNLKSVCGYFPFLPSTVKTVIIGVRIDEFTTENSKFSSPKVQDSLFQNYISAKVNATNDFSFVKNYENRACLMAGLKIMVTDVLDNDAPGEESMNIIYPYLYPNNRAVATYKRDIERRNKETDSLFIGRVFNKEFVGLLTRTNTYLKSKNINFVVYLSPSSPDVKLTSKPEAKNFILKIEQNLPQDIEFVNCFYSLKADEFYDSVHPNRVGAEKLSKILARRLLKK